ncbi:MAG: phenylacetate-CoA oxygenase subunit PaaJ [Candidatus Kapaibacteriales bacterium]
MVKVDKINKDFVYQVLAGVKDPEIPIMSVLDMAIIREVSIKDDTVIVFITPTYSGCPAMKEIETSIKTELIDKGVADVRVITVLSPAWTTDWMSDEAKEKLRQSGIAPPQGSAKDNNDPFKIITEERIVKCPYCSSTNTKLTSEFGSTACKSLYHCNSCGTPFDYFKCH